MNTYFTGLNFGLSNLPGESRRFWVAPGQVTMATDDAAFACEVAKSTGTPEPDRYALRIHLAFSDGRGRSFQVEPATYLECAEQGGFFIIPRAIRFDEAGCASRVLIELKYVGAIPPSREAIPPSQEAPALLSPEAVR